MTEVQYRGMTVTSTCISSKDKGIIAHVDDQRQGMDVKCVGEASLPCKIIDVINFKKALDAKKI